MSLLVLGGLISRVPRIPFTDEFITTVESQASWNGDPTDATAVVAAFDEAITEANANAGSSSTGRGVVELVQGTTYLVEASNGSGMTSLGVAVDMRQANVEIRTQGKPTIASGNQAIIKFKDWAGQTGVGGRSIVIMGADNVKLGWVELHGNKLSTGADAAARQTYLENDIDYTVGGNGGLMNLTFYGPASGMRVKEVNAHDALIDGFFMRQAGTGTITDLEIEDSETAFNRRQGMTGEEGGDPNLGKDQIIWRRVKFRETGDQSEMVGERPGAGIDLEPLSSGRPYHGWTYDDCDFSDNHGSSFDKGSSVATSSGRGFLYDGASLVKDFKMLGCRAERNRRSGVMFNLRNGGDVDEAEITDLVASGSEGGSAFDEILFDDNTASGTAFITNTTITNANVSEIEFAANLPDTGHSVTIWEGDFNPTVTKNGATTITVNAGFPP